MDKPTKTQQKKIDKAIDLEVERAYRAGCNGIQIDMMAIPTVFAKGKAAYLAGKRGPDLATAIREYVDTIRKN